MHSFKVGVKTSPRDRDWSYNGVRFATEAEAHTYALDLAMRWTMVHDWTVVPATEAPDRS